MVHIQSPGDNPLTELDVDDISIERGLWQLGLHAACPRVHKLTLSCNEEVTADLIKTACSSFSHLTELQVKPHPVPIRTPSVTDAVSFCDAVISPCPRLTKLSITDIILGNDVAAGILRGMIDHTLLENLTWVEIITSFVNNNNNNADICNAQTFPSKGCSRRLQGWTFEISVPSF